MSFLKEKLHIKFSEEYNKLNEQQRKAVDTIEGPVMVIAGQNPDTCPYESVIFCGKQIYSVMA